MNNISIWDKESFIERDVVVIGAGLTGLSTAASLKEQNPRLKVTVLERGIIPSGASTKNAGFACFGSVSELMNDIRSMGETATQQLVEKRWDGLQKTCQRLGRSRIDIQMKGGYELVFDTNTEVLDGLPKVNEVLQDFFQQDVFQIKDESIRKFGFQQVSHLIYNSFEGQLDPGKLVSSLWKYCAELGVQIHTGVLVDDLIEHAEVVKVTTQATHFKAKQVAICTNAFSAELVPDLAHDLNPGRGMILCVVPKTALSFEGTFHFDAGYYYFRDFNGKLIFGGGRNQDIRTETTTSFGINPTIKERLIAHLDKVILPQQDYTIDTEWSGIMAFGRGKTPMVERINDKIVVGARLGGMGVAIGSVVGEDVATLIMNSDLA